RRYGRKTKTYIIRTYTKRRFTKRKRRLIKKILMGIAINQFIDLDSFKLLFYMLIFMEKN
ncbi:MAG TPA: hypothetical protein VFV86_01775, partial [Nitrososphaeraceae archaeon]|nr:hypothetical protein [Nitrososphaeraceae archaeon]